MSVMVQLHSSVIRPILFDLMPFQLSLDLGRETPRPVFREPNANPLDLNKLDLSHIVFRNTLYYANLC